MPTTRRQLGFPFRGYNAAQRRWQAPLDSMTDASQDYLIDPAEGKLVHRGGSYLLGQAIKDINEVTSQFESGPTYGDLYARQVIELPSDSITDGLPTHAVLYSNDATAGVLVFMSPNTYTVASCSMTAGDQTLTTATADGFRDVTVGAAVSITGLTGTAQILSITNTTTVELTMAPTANITTQTATIGGATHGLNLSIGRWAVTTSPSQYPDNFKMVPVMQMSNRCITAAHRAKIATGTRRALLAGRSLYFGNADSTNAGWPIRWNRNYNDRRATDANNERVFPMGNIPPLWMNVADGSAAISGPTPNWAADKTYFFSMMFGYADGSWSQPFVPQYKSTAGGNFFGFHKVSTACDALTITMPIGPAEVERRAILRTVAGTTTVPPALVDENGNSLLGIAAIIENNTETSYSLKEGNDFGIAFDPTVVRFDRAWAPPSRFLWAGDQRIWGASTLVHPGGIIVCSTATADNADDDPATTGNSLGVYGTDGSITSIVFGAATFTPTATMTVQDLVDDINASTADMAAQIVPGTDPATLASRIFGTGASAGNGTDYGDTTDAAMTVRGNAWPAVISFSSDVTGQFAPKTQRIWFGIGGPGTKPFGPDTRVGNFREGPLRWGPVLGGASLLDGQIVCFTNAIAICRNIRDGKTGLDDDYRLEALNESRGCISDASIVAGDGWVGYMTRDGYVVTDGTREVIISGELYNPATDRGILQSPIASCISALSTRAGEACARYCTAWVSDSKLFLGLSLTATSPSTANDPVLVYDYSAGSPASGLAEILRPDGTPYGWSAPLSYSPSFPGVRSAVVGGSVGRLKDSGAGRRMVVASSYLSTTSAAAPHGFIGRIMEPTGADMIELVLNAGSTFAATTNGTTSVTIASGDLTRIAVGATIIVVADTASGILAGSTVASVSGTTVVLDRAATLTGSATVIFQGKDIEPYAYLATDIVNTQNMKSLQGMWVTYNQVGTGMALVATNELDRTGQTTYSLPAVASGDGFSRQKINVSQALRGLSKGYEVYIVDKGTTTNASEIWGVETIVEVLESHR